MPSIFEVYTDFSPRSVMPGGGSPTTDRDYLIWRESFVAQVNARWADFFLIVHGSLPDRELIDMARIDEVLFLGTGGTRMTEPPTYQHRLRHLGIVFRDRPSQVVRTAARHAFTLATQYEGRR